MTIAYTISISNPGGTGDAAGFIDNLRYGQYGAQPVVYQNAKDKKRGNFRYQAILESLGMVSNPVISDVVATGANTSTAATTFTFVLTLNSDYSVGIVRDGNPLIGIPAIKRLIAEAISVDRTHVTDIADPTSVAITETLVVGKLVANVASGEALVTVTAVV